MNSRAVSQIVFVAGMVLAPGAFAGADVVKCTAPSGHITLTDQTCPANAEQVVLAGATSAAAEPEAVEDAAPPAVRSGSRYQLSSLPPAPRPRATGQAEPPGRALARDVATLKQARRALLLLDGTMTEIRHPGLAAK